MPSVILHISNEEPILGEVEAVPTPTDVSVLLKNPRRRDGKDLPNVEANVNIVVWPMWRITFIEILGGSEEEEIITFVRE